MLEEKIEKAKIIYNELGLQTEKFEISRIEEINADLFLPKENQRGIGGVIIGDDGTYLVCGSIYPISHYIEDFKNGERNTME